MPRAKDLDRLTEAAIEWLSLDNEARTKHAAKARQYAFDNLSVESRVLQRFEFWHKMIHAPKGA